MAGKPSSKDLIIEKAFDLVMQNGYAATSIDMILDACNLTKGAFFYHFKSKAELGVALAKRYVSKDNSFFFRFMIDVEARTDDPLERMLLFLENVEKDYDKRQHPPGCLFASFSYDSHTEEMAEFMDTQVQRWRNHYARLFTLISEKYPPSIEVDEEELGDHFMCTIQGGYHLARIYQKPEKVAVHLRHLKNYIRFIYGQPESNARGATASERIAEAV
jgi:TetR/AcrR family transcriptional repressor of nem operon